ncbi:hypothetical protein F511_40678 [Dorcoceras hygrometricum]|uniref:Uncharacterized protein n=1 Tax=Dorcoceras hygrometricum TaxID=472368 RepID=A0A2Z7A7C6_9LAMI|nr:hypothetical protein F511_40678 [Dorcoceras hygrometricum]
MLTEAPGWEPRSTHAITTNTTNRKLNSRLGTRFHRQGMKFYLSYSKYERAATSRSSTSQLQPPKVVWNGELLERSPTLPQTYQTIAGNDGKLLEKLKINSTRVRRTEVDNREKIY